MTLGEDGVYRGKDSVHDVNYTYIHDEEITKREREKFSYQKGWYVSEPLINVSRFDGAAIFTFDLEKYPTMEDALDRYQQTGIELVDGVLVSKKRCSR